MAIEPIAGNEVDRPTKQHRQFVPHALKSHEADSSFVPEVDQDIDIAVGSLFATGQRTENGQFPHSMGSTKTGKRSGGKGNLGRHGDDSDGNAAQFTSEPAMGVAPAKLTYGATGLPVVLKTRLAAATRVNTS